MTNEHRVSWNEFHELVWELIGRVSGDEFDAEVVAGVARGGLPLAVCLSHKLNLSLAVFDMVGYDEKERLDELNFRGHLGPVFDVDKVLIVDDIADSGRTLNYLSDMVEWWGGDVRTGVLHHKPGGGHEPDYAVEETDRWIVYPWES